MPIAATVLLLALALALPLAAQQQSDSAPPAQQDQSTPNAPAPQKSAQTKKKPSETQQNPFPEAQSEAAAHQAQQPQDSPPSAPAPQNVPAAPQPQNGKPSTADRNPFPEAQSENAQRSQEKSDDRKSTQNGGQTSAADPGSGKSPDDYSSSHLRLLDLPGDNDAANPDAGGANGHNPALATKDTQVGMFYLKTGDYKGAYDRFAEATKADPGNADAVFGLAESARRLNYRDEAVRNYRLYLSALPDGPRAKDSRKALKELGVNPNS
ncbi:MAG TPA: tetratricopeptide repeat protein [Acidobacteriaceae bacterium]|nr:tetratricopeptide repeat protein [Acidobacteriaceae bacterium]